MSVSKWAYAPEKCDGEPCAGDCDMCYKAEDEISIPSVDTLEYADSVNLTMTGNATAKPAEACVYPSCERCIHYLGHYCTVPIVISKQIFRLADEKMQMMEKRLSELETLVTDEILRSKEVRKHALHEDVNYTWADYFDKDDK